MRKLGLTNLEAVQGGMDCETRAGVSATMTVAGGILVLSGAGAAAGAALVWGGSLLVAFSSCGDGFFA